MANPFLDDFLFELEQEENRKTGLETRTLFPKEPEAVPQPQKNILYDMIGSGLWSFVDEFGFGVPEIVADSFGFEEEIEQLRPTTPLGKLSSAVGSLAGFVTGAPMKVGLKGTQMALKPFVKKAVSELGEGAAEKYVVGSAKNIYKKSVRDAVADSGVKREIVEDVSRDYFNLVGKSSNNKHFAKRFMEKSGKSIDDALSTYLLKGDINGTQAAALKGILKRDLTRRPIQNFKDLFTLQGKNPRLGHLIDDVVMFGTIDALIEVPHSIAQERPYDVMAPVWGAGIGFGFGALGWMAPKGKLASVKNDMLDGMKAAFGKDIFAGKDKKQLTMHANMLSGWLSKNAGSVTRTIAKDGEDKASDLIRSVTRGGKDYRVDLGNPGQLFQNYDETLATNLLRDGLNQVKTKYGRELINWSAKEEWKALSENWLKMVLGGTIMNARSIYELSRGADVKWDDMLPGMLIGAYLNRRGNSTTWDFNDRVNRLRANLSMLGVETRNLTELPFNNSYINKHLNPIEHNPILTKARKKAEDLSIISDSFEATEMKPLIGEETVFINKVQKGEYEVFESFYKLLMGQKKHIKPLDNISTKDAKQIESILKGEKWPVLGNKKIKTAEDAYRVFEDIQGGSTQLFDRSMLEVIAGLKGMPELGITYDIDIDAGSVGSFPEFINARLDRIDDMPNLYDYAEQGRFEFLKDADNKPLTGQAAKDAVDQIFYKVNEVIGTLGDNPSRGGISKLNLKKADKNFLVDDPIVFEDIHNLIDKFESDIGVAINGNFDVLTHLPDVRGVLLLNQTKITNEKISNLFSQGSGSHDNLIEAMGPLLRGGIAEPRVLIDNANAPYEKDFGVNITGVANNDPVVISQYRKFLNNVIGIMGAKGQYDQTRLTNNIDISVSEIETLKNFLGKNGMKTDHWIMDKFNNNLVEFILRENIKGSRLGVEDVNLMKEVQSAQGIDIINFNNRAGAKGWKVKELTTNSKNEDIVSTVDKWNQIVKELREKGETVTGDNLISKGETYNVDDPNVANLIENLIEFRHTAEGIGVKEVLTDYINSLSSSHVNFANQMRLYVNNRPSNARYLLEWLEGAGHIYKDKADSYLKFKVNDKGITDDTIALISKRMEESGVHIKDGEYLFKVELDRVNDMHDEIYRTPSDDASMSKDQFFNRYFPNKVGLTSSKADPKAQDRYLDTILDPLAWGVKDKPDQIFKTVLDDMSFRIRDGKDVSVIKGKDLDLKDWRQRYSYEEGKRQLIGQLLTKAGSKPITVLSNTPGGVMATDKTMFVTKFFRAIDDMGFHVYPVTGTAEGFFFNGKGQIVKSRYNMFESMSNKLPDGPEKSKLAQGLKDFKDAIGSQNVYKTSGKWTDPQGGNFVQLGNNEAPGASLFMIAQNLQPFAVSNFQLPLVRQQYADLIARYEGKLNPEVLNEMNKALNRMGEGPEDGGFNFRQEHEYAMRHLLYEKMITSKKSNENFVNLLNQNYDFTGDPGKLSKRFSLFHTPNFQNHDMRLTELSKSIASNSTNQRRQTAVVNKFKKKKNKIGVSVWNDSKNADIKSMLEANVGKGRDFATVAEAKKYWETQLNNMDSESGFDSITFVSKDFMDYLSLSYGFEFGKTNIFKPIINANGDNLLYGKTVFAYEPLLDRTFFKNNPNVDILTTKTASKIIDPKWELVDAPLNQVANVKNAAYKNIEFGDVVLKPDRVKPKDYAKLSQSTYNYMDFATAGEIYKEFYSGSLDSQMQDFLEFYNNPNTRRAFFASQAFGDQSVESMMEGAGGTQKLAGARLYAAFGGDPVDLGEQMVMSQFYRKVLDPTVNQASVFNKGGNLKRWGGKSVLIRSLDPQYYVKSTLATDGVVNQYGEVFLPNMEQNSSLETLGRKLGDEGLQIKLVKNNKEVVELDSVFPKEFVDTNVKSWTLGNLHKILKRRNENTRDDYQVAIITNRYPRTRPNDLTILGLKGFLAKEYGNSMIAPELDVLNIFEGDYDVDKNDYFWMHSKNVFKHVQENMLGGGFVQGIDPSKYDDNIPGLHLTGRNAESINKAWHSQISNASVLKKQIGGTQKKPRILNFMKELGTPDENGMIVLYQSGKDKVVIDYNNADWFFRTVEETQAIIDAGDATKAIDRVGPNERNKQLFPLMKESQAQENVQDRMGFIKEQRNNTHKRIRLFRKYKEGKGEIDLDQVDVDILGKIYSKYSEFLNIGTSIYDNTGASKKPSYHDIMNNSETFFTFMRDLNKGMFYSLHYKHKDNPYWQELFKPGEAVLKSSRWKQKKGVELTPEDMIPVKKRDLFSRDAQTIANRISNGEDGNVFERIMNKVWSSDPLKVRDYTALNRVELEAMEEAMARMVDNPEGVNQFAGEFLNFTKNHNKSISALKFLISKWSWAERTIQNQKTKKRVQDNINAQKNKLETGIWDMLPESYKKHKTIKNLNQAFIKVKSLDNKELKEGVIQQYSMGALSKMVHINKKAQDDINILKDFEARAFGDIIHLGNSMPFDKNTIKDSKTREWLKNIPDYATVEDIIDFKLDAMVRDHGGLQVLWHYASLPRDRYSVGIFNDQALSIPYAKNGRMSRVIRFLTKRAGDDLDMQNALKGVAKITSHYRKYFNSQWQFMDDLLKFDTGYLDKDLGLTFEGLRFPEFDKRVQSAFDSFSDYRWKKQTNLFNDPFHLQTDHMTSFYRELFDLQGRGDEFNEYRTQVRRLNENLQSTELMDPITYLNTVTRFNKDIHSFANKDISGMIDPDGRFYNVESITPELKQNPIFHLMGGEKYFKNFALSPPQRAMNTNIRSIVEYAEQAMTIKIDNPSSRKFGNILEEAMKCAVGGAK